MMNHSLSREDVLALRKATSLVLIARSDGPGLIRCIHDSWADKPSHPAPFRGTERDDRIEIDGIETIVQSYERDTNYHEPLFAIASAHPDLTTHQALSFALKRLRPGDCLLIRFWAGSHSTDITTNHGITVDRCVLDVYRNGKWIDAVEVDTHAYEPDSSIRMVQPARRVNERSYVDAYHE
jgi:hypothetical protein